MVELISWVERQWSFTLPVGAFAAVLERLKGTPARAADLIAGIPDERLAVRLKGKWSVKEHLGHLSDLHALGVRRVEDFLSRAEVLTAADMSNRQTYEARHNAAPATHVLDALRQDRRSLALRLEPLTELEIAGTALHPRLGVRMRLLDWAQFVADHDDHHLASARAVLRSLAD